MGIVQWSIHSDWHCAGKMRSLLVHQPAIEMIYKGVYVKCHKDALLRKWALRLQEK